MATNSIGTPEPEPQLREHSGAVAEPSQQVPAPGWHDPSLLPNLGTRPHSTRAPVECAFCAIAYGEACAAVVRTWPDAVAIKPRGGGVAKGHLLVIPRAHVNDAGADPIITASAMARAAELLAAHPDANLITSRGVHATQTVGHLHIHVIPRERDDGLPLPWTPQHAAPVAAQGSNCG